MTHNRINLDIEKLKAELTKDQAFIKLLTKEREILRQTHTQAKIDQRSLKSSHGLAFNSFSCLLHSDFSKLAQIRHL